MSDVEEWRLQIAQLRDQLAAEHEQSQINQANVLKALVQNVVQSQSLEQRVDALQNLLVQQANDQSVLTLTLVALNCLQHIDEFEYKVLYGAPNLPHFVAAVERASNSARTNIRKTVSAAITARNAYDAPLQPFNTRPYMTGIEFSYKQWSDSLPDPREV